MIFIWVFVIGKLKICLLHKFSQVENNNENSLIVFLANDNGYHWKQTAELIANYPTGDIWTYQTMAVSEDGNSVFLAGNPESILGVNIWIFESNSLFDVMLILIDLNGNWILTGGFFDANNFASSSDSTGSNFVLAGQNYYSDGQFISYLIQSPFSL